jgi:hypothetical protein
MLPPARWQRFCRTRPAAATRQSCAGGSLGVVACAAVVSMCFRSSHGWLLKDMVRNGCGASAGELAGRLGDVELGRVFAVGGAVLAAFFELHPQFNDLLFESDDALLKLVDVGGCTESGCAPGLFAEQFGRVSSCWVRAAMRVQRCWAASRSARSEARVTGAHLRFVWWRGCSGVEAFAHWWVADPKSSAKISRRPNQQSMAKISPG